MDRSAGRLRARLAERGWPVASAPAALLLYFAIVEAATVVLVCVAVTNVRPGAEALATAAFMLCLAIAFEEGANRVARIKIRLDSDFRTDMTSVWTVSAAVVLQPGLAAVMVTCLASYIGVRQVRAAGKHLHRWLFNIFVLVLTTLLTSWAIRSMSPAWERLPWALGAATMVLIAMAINGSVNRLLISFGLMLLGAPLRELRGTKHDNLIELATLCLGGLVAIAALQTPWLCVLVLAPMVTLQRGALVRELEAAATIDAKTGMLNAVAWEQLAKRELAHAQRDSKPLSVLVIDIDRFKLVNDQFGHLVGDEVLRSVGKVLAAQVREYDTVGRFGGEEFVAVLPDAHESDAMVVAERLRSRINELRVSQLVEHIEPDGDADLTLAVSIGVSCTPTDGSELSDLLIAADAALYQAKAGGRNRVVLAHRGSGPAFERATHS